MSKSFPSQASATPSQAAKADLEKLGDKPSPGLTKEQILKSIYQKPQGPVRGLPVVGAGGYKPFRPPPEGTVAKRFVKFSPKPLRHPSTWSK